MKYYILVISFILGALSCHDAQSITVLDSTTERPVENVVCRSKRAYDISDKSGRIELSTFNKNDTLHFSHVGYEQKNILLEELDGSKQIFLIPKEILTDEVVVQSKQYKSSSIQTREVVEINDQIKSSFNSVGDLLKTSTSLYIKDYGGGEAVQQVSSRGMSSENTIVLFNEARINDLRTGSFNLSQISSSSLEKVEFYKNSDWKNNYSTAGGVLKLYSGNLSNENKTSISLKKDLFGLNSFQVSDKRASESFSFSVNFERAYSSNKFEYDFIGREYERKNAFFSKTFLSNSLSYKSTKLIIENYFHYSHFRNGIPGFVVSYNTNSSRAVNETNSFLNILNINYSFNEFTFLHTTLSYHQQELNYYDPLPELFFDKENIESEIKEIGFNSRFGMKLENTSIMLGFELSKPHLTGIGNYLIGEFEDDFDRSLKRIYLNATRNLGKNGFVKNLILSGGISYEFGTEELQKKYDYDFLSGNFGLSFTPAFNEKINFNVTIYKNKRIPTFNERFYSSLFSVNPLDPEDYWGIDVGSEWKFGLFDGSVFSLTYYMIKGENKILWLPTRMAQQSPKNFGNVKIEGLEVGFNSSIVKNVFEAQMIYNFNSAKNRNKLGADDNSFDKYLVYSPLNRLNANIFLHINDFSLSVYNSFVDKRYYTSDNTERNKLDPYFITDVSISYNFGLFKTKEIVTISGQNIFREKYFIIQSYPMPLDNYSITLKVEI